MKFARPLFSFDGRLRRRDWWLLSALLLLVETIASNVIAGGLTGVGVTSTRVINAAVLGTFFVLQWPAAALNVRRFHDRDRRGWPGGLYVAVLAVLVVILGLAGTSLPALIQREDAIGVTASALMMIWMPVSIWMFVVLGLASGTPGPNRFGPSPKGIGDVARTASD